MSTQTIKLKRSSSSGAVPSTSDLALGELAVNTYDGKIFMKKEVGGSPTILQFESNTTDTNLLKTFTYTATANQITFTGVDDNGDSLKFQTNAVQVLLNGLMLTKTSDFTVPNASRIDLVSGATAGDTLTVVAFQQKIGNGTKVVNSFTGDGSETDFTLTHQPENEDNTLVFVNGSYISKSAYSITGTTLSFSSAPASSAAIEISVGTNELSLNTSSGLTFPDATKVILGTSNDLQLFHDGNNSIINHVNTASNGNMLFQVSGSTIGTVSGTGMAVNGAISATGELSGTSDGGAF